MGLDTWCYLGMGHPKRLDWISQPKTQIFDRIFTIVQWTPLYQTVYNIDNIGFYYTSFYVICVRLDSVGFFSTFGLV